MTVDFMRIFEYYIIAIAVAKEEIRPISHYMAVPQFRSILFYLFSALQLLHAMPIRC